MPTLNDTAFCLLLVQTLNPTQANAPVVAVASARIQNFKMVDIFYRLINPEQNIQEEWVRQAGIEASMLEQQPTWDEVLPTLAQFIQRDILVWANPIKPQNAVTRHFRNAYSPQKTITLQALAQKILPELKQSNSQKIRWKHLADFFEIEWSHHFNLSQQIEIAAQVFMELLKLATEKQDIQTLSDLLNWVPPQKVAKIRTRNQLPFPFEKLKTYPTQPGVYFMKNKWGEILYIGKAKNLRNRLKSYFQRQSKLPPKIAAMMQQVSIIDVETVGSELEALLLEAQLIKIHQPFFNRKIKHYQHLVFLKISGNFNQIAKHSLSRANMCSQKLSEKIPAKRDHEAREVQTRSLPEGKCRSRASQQRSGHLCQESFQTASQISVSLDTEDSNALYFGPFHSRAELESKIDTINRVFKLRSCDDTLFAKHQQNPCMQYQIGQCSGPCALKISSQDYQASVQDFLDYLNNKPSLTIELLMAKRQAYAEALLFEKAAAVHDTLEQLEALQLRSYRLLQSLESHHGILVLPGNQPNAYRLLAVIQGLPAQWFTFSPQQDEWQTLETWVRTCMQEKRKSVKTSIPSILFEEARLIAQWIKQKETNPHQTVGWMVHFRDFHLSQIMDALQDILWEAPLLANMPFEEKDEVLWETTWT